jgi:uncharacterized protein
MSASSAAARQIIAALSLQPHPEGGWYREFYRSTDGVTGVNGARSCITSIYYLLERHQISRWHVVDADEIWHFYRGAPLQLHAYDPASRLVVPHQLSDSNPAAVIRRGVWQAAQILGDFTLVGCSVAPGFEFADFRFVADLPDHRPHFHAALAHLTHLL